MQDANRGTHEFPKYPDRLDPESAYRRGRGMTQGSALCAPSAGLFSQLMFGKRVRRSPGERMRNVVRRQVYILNS